MLIKARQIKSLSTSFVFHACCVCTFRVGSILQGHTERPQFLWSHNSEKQQVFNHVTKQTKHISIEAISLVRDLVSHVCQRVYINKERKRHIPRQAIRLLGIYKMRRCGHKIPRVSILSIPSSCNTSSCVTPTPLPSPQHFISSSTMSVPYQDRSSKNQTCCNNTDVPHLHKTGESLNAQKQYINLEEKGKKEKQSESLCYL